MPHVCATGSASVSPSPWLAVEASGHSKVILFFWSGKVDCPLVANLVIRPVPFYPPNLQPRQMTFGTSEGMVVAAGAGGEEIYLLSPDSGAKPGQRVH